jgi:DNA-binding GntR family transcriptional regulator
VQSASESPLVGEPATKNTYVNEKSIFFFPIDRRMGYLLAMPDKRDSPSLTDKAYRQLRSDLLACRLRPGEKLRMNNLCQAFSVSLSAVREALSRLTAEGLVIAEPQRGFRAAPVSSAELHDLTQVRVHIEAMCLRRAIAAGDVGWEERLVAAHHRLSRTPEREPGDASRLSDAWAEAHTSFHRALVSACDSPHLLEIREMLHARSERYRRISVPLSRALRPIAQEHEGIMQAALERDADRAVGLLSEHLELTSVILLQAEEKIVCR